MNAAAKKMAGLRRYHANRPAKTRLKLLEALDRMENGHTVVLGPEFKWSKTTLAREARVNINTVVPKRPSGEWAFPEINDRFEELRNKRRQVVIGSDAREEKIAELRNEVERLREQNRLLALEINRMGHQVLEDGERAEQMAVYERQNASLCEEIGRIQTGSGVPLRWWPGMRPSQFSGREQGEANLAKVRRYLTGLKAAGQSLPSQDGRPNITAIATACDSETRFFDSAPPSKTNPPGFLTQDHAKYKTSEALVSLCTLVKFCRPARPDSPDAAV